LLTMSKVFSGMMVSYYSIDYAGYRKDASNKLNGIELFVK
jgi:hypothetical protein